jgi:hypothetical protein
MSKSRARFLAELLNSSGQVKATTSSLAGVDGIIDLEVLPTIPNSQLEHSSISIAGHTLSLGGSLSLDTSDITEHASYLYYTDARVRGALSVSGSLAYNSSTGVISYTTPTIIASLSNHDTDDLSEGATNLYWTTARGDSNFDTRLATKTTSDLSEGTNLYYTDTRVGSYLTTNSYATQGYVTTAVSNLVDSAPATLDTLNELAAALGDDPNFATTVSNSIGTKWTQDNTKISNWDTAYGWGNHASAGYLASSSYTASDVLTKIKTVDGTGSGLDADLLDGVQGSGYQTRLLQQSGRNLVLATGSTAAGGLFLENSSGQFIFQLYGDQSQYGFLSSEWASWDIKKTPGGNMVLNNSDSNIVWHAGNDGSGSGLDADLLDGQQGSYYAIESSRSSVPSTGNYVISDSTSPQTLGGGYLRHDFWNSFGGGGSGYRSVLSISSYTSGSQWTQLAFNYNSGTNAPIYVRQNDYNGTSWGSWNQLWDSANDGSGSGLDADLLDGLQLHTGRNNEANKVVRTDVNGYIQAGWINTPSGDSGIANRLARIYTSTDDYIRYSTLTDFKVHMSLSAKNNYSRRIDYSADANYHVGSFGHVGYGANETFHGGSGFFDIWSGTNYPSGLSHIHGFNALHYTTSSLGTTGGVAYGWQMALQYTDDNPYFRRCSGGSFSAWRKLWNDANDGSGSGLDADLLDGLQAAAFVQQGGSSYTVGNTAAFAGANDTTLSVRSNGPAAATMSFHRPGVFAANFGLDTDNQLKYGGWSAVDVHPVMHDGVFGGSVSNATNGGGVNYVYVDSNVTYAPTRGSCGNHVYQCWHGTLTLTLNDASWQRGDIVVLSNVRGTANIVVNASVIYMPNGSNDNQVTWNATVGSFRLCKYSNSTGYWMVLP